MVQQHFGEVLEFYCQKTSGNFVRILVLFFVCFYSLMLTNTVSVYCLMCCV